MGYTSKNGRRPNEYASKSSHSYLINDPFVDEFLQKIINLNDIEDNPINYIIAIDGGYSEVSVRKEFPSSTISFFQFGALIFSVVDLNNISKKPFIFPEDIAKLKNIQRIKLVLPTKNITPRKEVSLIDLVRKAIFEIV